MIRTSLKSLGLAGAILVAVAAVSGGALADGKGHRHGGHANRGAVQYDDHRQGGGKSYGHRPRHSEGWSRRGHDHGYHRGHHRRWRHARWHRRNYYYGHYGHRHHRRGGHPYNYWSYNYGSR